MDLLNFTEQEDIVSSPANYHCSGVAFSHKWTISNYSRVYNEGYPWKWRICSDSFSPPNNNILKFVLQLYPKGNKESVKDYVSIGVHVINLPKIYDGKIKCQWNVSIEDENGERWESRDDSNGYYLFNNRFTVITNYICYSALLNCASKYLPMDQLTLHFEFNLQADDRIFNVITNNEVDWSLFDCANKVTNVAHTWTVENFVDWFSESAVAPYFIQSEYFPKNEEQSEEFCLNLYPNGYSEERSDNVDICILKNNENSATVQAIISILDVDGEKCCEKEQIWIIRSNIKFFYRFNRSFLLDNSNGLVCDGKLRIHLEMSYMMNSIENNWSKNNMQISDTVIMSESVFDVSQKAVHFVSHEWTIDKFSALCHDSSKDNFVDSPVFRPPTDTRFTFHLRLWPNGYDKDSKDYLSLQLYNLSQQFSQIKAQYRISILDAKGNRWIKWDAQSIISKFDKVRMSDFISHSVFKNASLIHEYQPCDNLTIICELWTIQDKKIYKTKPINTQPIVNYPSASTTVNMSNSNFQGAIVNVQGTVSMNDLTVNISSTNNNSTENNVVNVVAAEAKQVTHTGSVADNGSN